MKMVQSAQKSLKISNQLSLGIDYATEITTLVNGNWVVTWHELGNQPDGSSSNVFMRVYDVNGNPVTDATMVNSQLEGIKANTSVVALHDGGWVVAWHSGNDLDGSGYGIYAQAYNSDGTQRGAEFQVNSAGEGNQQHVATASLTDGGWVACWVSDTEADPGVLSINSQMFNADGSRYGEEKYSCHIVWQPWGCGDFCCRAGRWWLGCNK